MTAPRHIAVIDIGKTNAKLALVDLERLREIDVVTRPNRVIPGPPWTHFDTDGHWDFLIKALADFHHRHRIDAISVTTHGASIVLLDGDGALAAPILDYEHRIPAEIAAEYDRIRPDFAQTGSPRLAGGLNAGAQLHYQFSVDPGLVARTKTIIGYPQYWGFRLTGKLANDVTSIGCHTDLWSPGQARLTDVPARLGVAEKMAPVRRSDAVLGTLLPQIAAQTGLPPETRVVCGIHDSNASLYPHLLTQDAPFSVVSTGTWVIAMAVGDHVPPLDAARDTLINVNAFGDPVPSARFMGGREFEMMGGAALANPCPDDRAAVLADVSMILPAIAADTGPFKGSVMQMAGAPLPQGSGRLSVALSFYLALMTQTCLDLITAQGPVIVEGPFAANRDYLAMLQAASGRRVLHSESATGTSIGAALLVGSSPALQPPQEVAPPQDIAALARYAALWRDQVNARNYPSR